MAIHLIKPLVWNPIGYRGPGGVPRTRSGVPYEYGYGLEEWNGLETVVDDQRLFYTQVAERDHARYAGMPGEVTLLMVASNGTPVLVGVARRATFLARKADRRRLLAGIDLETRADVAWATSSVRRAFEDDEQAFRRSWKKESHWSANWACPVGDFRWLREPIPFSRDALGQDEAFAIRYNHAYEISEATASRIIGQVFAAAEEPVADPAPDQDADIAAILAGRGTPGEKLALIRQRLGQGAYRDAMIARWGGACAVTGCDLRTVLVASHAKPWSICEPDEQMDPDNGLLLDPTFDRLFDRGLISFCDDGRILVSPLLQRSEIDLFALRGRRLRLPLSREARTYMGHHRTQVFPGKGPLIRG